MASQAVRVGADQIAHLDARCGETRKAQRQTADRADMILELRRLGALDRPVPAIVHARRHFVENRLVAEREELHRHHPDIVERRRYPAGQRAPFFNRSIELPSGRHR